MWASVQDAITQLVGTSVGSMSFWERILYLIGKYGPSYLEGAGNTLLIAIISTAVGCVIGLGAGIVQTIPVSKKDNPAKRFVIRFFQALLRIYVEVFRGTPMMIEAVFVY